MTIEDYRATDLALTPKDYQDALFVQSACNLSGVAKAFAAITTQLWAEANAQGGKGTEWVNQHPISILFCHQMVFLTGRESFSEGPIPYMQAHGYCEGRSR